MSREIKFKIYYKGGKTMSPVSRDIWELATMDVTSDGIDEAKREVVWLQYTGLKDKNGVEIYEGDITSEGVVRWFNDLAWDGGGSSHPGFYFERGIYSNDLCYHTGFDEDIEVIGNIYENPELLEES